MLQEKAYYIIGNSYEKFSSMENTFSFDEVIKEALNPNNLLSHALLILGQGLSIAEKNMLKRLEERGRIGFIVNSRYKLASQELSHKTKSHNTMISEPLLVEKHKKYISYLLLDDDCAEMSDHITGMHLQGMVLTEAARQVMLAVGEKFLLPETLKGNAYFALRKMSSAYHRFAFPLDMKLIHEIKKVRTKKDMCIVESTTFFEQNDAIVAEVDIDYVASDKDTLASKEVAMAENALNRSIQQSLLKNHIDMCA